MSDDTELLDFSAAVTFEHETKPPYTVRLDFAATDFEAANKTAVFRAFKMRPKGILRSCVVVIERAETVNREVARQKALQATS